MKYIKLFENNNEILSKLSKTLKKFLMDFFEVPSDNYPNNGYEIQSKNYLYGKLINLGIKNPNGALMICFSVEMYIENKHIKIKVYKNYNGIDSWAKSSELQEYLHSIIKPLSKAFDPNNMFDFIRLVDLEELISKMNMKEYNFRVDANKYNL